jgi:3-oxoadipate CoA-transferase beta subunit
MLQGVSAEALQAATEAPLRFTDTPSVIALDAAGAPRYVRG